MEADDSARDGVRELQYLVNAVAAGADSTTTLHKVSGSLIRSGLPWLFPRYAQIADYRRALLAAKRTGDGTALVSLLVTSARKGRV